MKNLIVFISRFRYLTIFLFIVGCGSHENTDEQYSEETRAIDASGGSQHNQVVAETEELAQAIHADDIMNTREELGDALFTLISLAVLAEEKGDFLFADAMADIEAKIIRRHPHVFGGMKAENIDEACRLWKEAKSAEKSDCEYEGDVESP